MNKVINTCLLLLLCQLIPVLPAFAIDCSERAGGGEQVRINIQGINAQNVKNVQSTLLKSLNKEAKSTCNEYGYKKFEVTWLNVFWAINNGNNGDIEGDTRVCCYKKIKAPTATPTPAS